MGSIPALRYTIRHSLDRLQRQHLYYEQEILTSRKLMFGMPGITTSFYGVVSGTDPTSHVSSSSDPLVVSENSQNTLTVDVNPGYGVFLSGVWIQLHAAQLQIALADTTPGVPNVVFLQYILDTAVNSLNDGLQPVSPYTFRIGGTIDTSTLSESVLIGTMTVTDYLSLAASIREDYIPLAIVTVQTLSGGITTDLSIDHTQASYSWNRPWFSPVDIYHRSQIGTGTATATNPHATSGNDLTYADFTTLQVHLDYGMILADDKSVAKVPGYWCEERTSTFLGPDDFVGTVTGYPGSLWVELTHYPVAVGKCWYDAGSIPLAGLHVPNTNLVVFPYDAPAAEVHITYTRVEACEPPLPNATTFLTSGPAEEELIIAGGLGLDALANVEETMGDAWQFPQRYDFFVDGTGALLKTPQVVYCWKTVTALIAAGLDPTTITPYGPGFVLAGLMGAGPGPWTLSVRIHGTNTTGTTINHLFSFSSASWVEPGPAPNPVVTNQAFLKSFVTFATVTEVEVAASTGVINPNAGIMLWMLQTPYSNYDKMKDACHVASAVWNGYYFSSMWDKRVISTTARPELTTTEAPQMEMLISLLAGANSTVYYEDLRRPKYSALLTADYSNYPTYNLSKWQPGIHGGYFSIAFPIDTTVAGNTWTITLFGQPHRDNTFMTSMPAISVYDPIGAIWSSLVLSTVPGMPTTFRGTTTGLFVPSRIMVSLHAIQAQAYVIYG
jgi:hypothetical protein